MYAPGAQPAEALQNAGAEAIILGFLSADIRSATPIGDRQPRMTVLGYATCTGAKQTSYAFGSPLSGFAIQACAGAQLGRLAMVIRLGYHLELEMKEMASA
jgi:hypothetical protein